MGKLFYAVKVGREPGIYRRQKQALEQIRDFSRGEWVRFVTLEEAERYLRDSVCNIDYDWLIREKNKKFYKDKVSSEELSLTEELEYTEKYSKEPDILVAYTDGSAYRDYAAYGVVFVQHNQVLEQLSGIKKIYPQKCMSLQAEIHAVEASIMYGIKHQYKKIMIFHDLSTLGLAAYGQVHIHTPIYREYQRSIQDMQKHIDIHFIKVKGHRENPFNNLADQLAKDLIIKKKKK
ncbi:ribonuclease H family protein [Ammoniphilus sp. YIM 78166]|uniref:ribonuclease H family protein n=1 Tax=Ammoniphilus sp. YIM 78166 TaxID=1644106 RepID=UPI001430628B|nr:ribonuclease H family protein [Ammoniphilus sp. YIM 78166]